MNNTNSQTSVYVETDVLYGWSAEMNSINESAISVLESFVTTLEELDNYWLGESATGFKNATNSLMTTAKSYHNNMKNVSAFLNDVVITMESE